MIFLSLQKIQAQIRPISQNQTTTIGQTQVRMIIPASASRPIGHTTITKQPTSGIRIQGPANGPRLINTQIRGPMSQPTTAQLQTQSSHAVSQIMKLDLLILTCPILLTEYRPNTCAHSNANKSTCHGSNTYI